MTPSFLLGHALAILDALQDRMNEREKQVYAELNIKVNKLYYYVDESHENR